LGDAHFEVEITGRFSAMARHALPGETDVLVDAHRWNLTLSAWVFHRSTLASISWNAA
jgi:hypothetical protein